MTELEADGRTPWTPRWAEAPSSPDRPKIPPAFAALAVKLRKAYARRTSEATRDLLVGIETRLSTEYAWHGLRRGGDADHPSVVFQYTLGGWGAYEEGGAVQRIMPGLAFLAVVPGDHRYYLPAESEGWTFFFMIVRHPYVVRRIVDAVGRWGATLAFDPNTVLMAKAVRLFEGVCAASFRDGLDEEQAVFEFLFEYERHALEAAHPRSRRQALLDDTRQFVLARLDRPFDVTHLADRRGMSRSHFGHYFKAATGLSPAKFVTDVRLAEVHRLLLQTDAPLKEIARATGFADANHLCKAFRRSHHISPAAFRRQMR